jgi:hypothetical protein
MLFVHDHSQPHRKIMNGKGVGVPAVFV